MWVKISVFAIQHIEKKRVLLKCSLVTKLILLHTIVALHFKCHITMGKAVNMFKTIYDKNLLRTNFVQTCR